MSKLSEAVDKAKREAEMSRSPLEPTAPPPPPVAAVEGATILPLTRPRPERSGASAREAVRAPGERSEVHRAPEAHMVSLVSPRSFEAEQFRALRHLVERHQRDSGLRVLAVTSAAEGDGKSLVAANLAGALAQNRESSILLVDCDLRSPSLRSHLGLRGPATGVSELVEHPELELEDLLVRRASYNLTILQAGRPPAAPYETLKSQRFAYAMAEARSRFDYVVIDTPPILVFPDTRLLDEHIDGYLLVVGADRTPRRQVEEAAGMLAEGKLLGLVFNGESQPKTYGYRATYARKTRSPWWRPWGD